MEHVITAARLPTEELRRWLAPAATQGQCMQEQAGLRNLIPESIDSKTGHLILLAMLLTDHGAVAVAQGVAARRAGASWDELRAVADMADLLHGLPAANRGSELLAALAEREREDRIAGIVAAYG